MNFRQAYKIILIAIFLVSCGPSDMQIEEAIQQTQDAQTRVTEIVEQVVIERVVTATPEATEEPSPTVAITPSATSCPDLEQGYSLYGIGFLDNDSLLFTIEADEDIEGSDFYLSVMGDEYPCETDDRYSDRLYCLGPGISSDQDVELVLWRQGEACELFEATAVIPERPSEDDGGSGGGSGSDDGNGSGGGKYQ